MPIFDTTLPTTIVLDAGYVSYDNGTALWMTRGGVTVTFAEEWQNVEYDGKRAPTYQLDRKISTVATMSMRIMQVSTSLLPKLMNQGGTQNIASLTLAEAGALTLAAAAAMAAFGDGVWPNMSALMTTNQYLTNVRGTFRRGDGKVVYVSFPLAMVKWTGIVGGDKDAAMLDVVIEARQDLSSSTDTDAAPWGLVITS